MKKLVLAGLMGFLACSPALYLPTTEVAQLKNHQLESLSLGRQLYIENCGSCHRLHLPGEFSGQAWYSFLDSMQHKAKITDGQKQLVLDYILSGK